MTSTSDWKAELQLFRASLAGPKVSRCLIKDLPVELFIIIFDFLKAEDRIRSFANLNRTSRKVYTTTLPILWKTVYWKWENPKGAVFRDWDLCNEFELKEVEQRIRDATSWSLLRRSRGAKHIQFLFGPLTFLDNPDEPADYELAETYSRQSKACVTFRTHTSDAALRKPGVFEIFFGSQYTFGTQDLVELMHGLQLPKGVKLEKEHPGQGIVRVLIPLWASYASTNRILLHPLAKTLPADMATFIRDIRIKVFYDDGTEDSKLLGAMHEALSMLVPAAMMRVVKVAQVPTLRIGKLTIAQAKVCAQAYLDACETEPSCKMMHLYLEIPAEASDEDQLSVDTLRSLFQPLIADHTISLSGCLSKPEERENMQLCIGFRRGTSFDGPYDGLCGILKWGVFEILDYSDPSWPEVMYKETIVVR
ncbi:hypothetical protein QFC22_000745 [Naganishia vaughanmartiniae]|uniref:Uncharacterized protein n=1 Tax=Naganishia vaughanmartiniae TaxID=1424756 RepID=A0ACC2XIV4_9TREE|nr:hypothetical protein QFC22_000745 [Naganishia vaughanmartiniae]